MELLALVLALEQAAGQRQADQQRHHRLAEEGQRSEHEALAQRFAGEHRNRAQADQQDRHEDRRERLEGAGQLAVACLQRGEVLGGRQRQAVVLQGDVLADEAIGPPHAGHGGDEGHQQAHRDHQPQAGIQPQVAGGGDRAGSRRHEGMRGVEAGGQRHAHRHHGDLHARGQGVLQRVEDDVAGVAEHRDRHQVADDRHGQGREALAEQLDHRFRHGDGRTAAFEDHPDDGAEHDDDADVAEDAAESAGDGLDDLGAGQLVGEAGNECSGQQCQEGVQFETGGGQHDEGDQRHQDQDQKHGLFLIVVIREGHCAAASGTTSLCERTSHARPRPTITVQAHSQSSNSSRPRVNSRR